MSNCKEESVLQESKQNFNEKSTENNNKDVSSDLNINSNEEDDLFDIKKKNNETQKMFLFRKEIYDLILNDTKSKQSAMVFSNIVINKLSMQCNYSQEINELIKPYQSEIEELQNKYEQYLK